MNLVNDYRARFLRMTPTYKVILMFLSPHSQSGTYKVDLLLANSQDEKFPGKPLLNY